MHNAPNPLGFGSPRAHAPSGGDGPAHVIIRHPLHRVLAFVGRSIDDVVNDPIVKNQVLGYYKVHKQVERACEVADLERQWNPPGKRVKKIGRG